MYLGKSQLDIFPPTRFSSIILSAIACQPCGSTVGVTLLKVIISYQPPEKMWCTDFVHWTYLIVHSRYSRQVYLLRCTSHLSKIRFQCENNVFIAGIRNFRKRMDHAAQPIWPLIQQGHGISSMMWMSPRMSSKIYWLILYSERVQIAIRELTLRACK